MILSLSAMYHEGTTYLASRCEEKAEMDPTLKEEVDFALYKTPYIRVKGEELLDKDQPLRKNRNISELFSAFNNTPFSKFPCVTVEAVRPSEHIRA